MKKSIRTKLMIVIIPITIITFLISSSILVLKGLNSIEEKSQKLLLQETNTCVEAIETTLNTVLGDAEILHENLELFDPSGKELDDFLAYTMTVNEAFPYGIYMGDKFNNYFDPSWVPDEGYIASERQWYLDGIDKSKMTFGEAYIDSQTGEICVSASCKLAAHGNDDMVLSIDVFLNSISEMVAQYEILDNGYCFLVNVSDGTIFSHPDSSLLGKNVYELDPKCTEAVASAYIGKNNNKIVEISSSTGDYVINVSSIGIGWDVVAIVPKSDMTGAVVSMIRTAVISTFLIVLILVVVLQISIRRTLKPIDQLTGNIEKMTSGDFTVEIKDRNNDEIGYMSNKLKEFVQKMRSMFIQIKEISETLTDQADNSTNTSTELSESANVQSDSMQKLNDTVEQLSISIDEVAENASSLVEAITTASDSSAHVNEKMNAVTSSTESGKTGMEKVSLSVKSSEEQMHKLKEVVNKVGEATSQINKFVDTIGDIANQTNLLSLNASIEAARAGEAGRGFAVVADEIRSLADTSSSSVSEISNITQDISVLVNEVMGETQNSVEKMQECNALVETVVTNFDDIYDSIQDASTNVSNMVKEFTQIGDMATNMAAIAEEQAASTTEIMTTANQLAKLAQSLSGNSQSVNEAAQKISDTSDVLAGYMKKYTL